MDAEKRYSYVRLESWLLSNHRLCHCVGHEEEADPFLRHVIAAGLVEYPARGAGNWRRCVSRRRQDLVDCVRF